MDLGKLCEGLGGNIPRVPRAVPGTQSMLNTTDYFYSSNAPYSLINKLRLGIKKPGTLLLLNGYLLNTNDGPAGDNTKLTQPPLSGLHRLERKQEKQNKKTVRMLVQGTGPWQGRPMLPFCRAGQLLSREERTGQNQGSVWEQLILNKGLKERQQEWRTQAGAQEARERRKRIRRKRAVREHSLFQQGPSSRSREGRRPEIQLKREAEPDHGGNCASLQTARSLSRSRGHRVNQRGLQLQLQRGVRAA